MNLYSIIVLALATLAGYRTAIKDLTAENKALREQNTALAADDANDKAKVAAAEAKAKEIADSYAETEAKGEELRLALEKSDDAPTVDENFAITEHGDAQPKETGQGDGAPQQ